MSPIGKPQPFSGRTLVVAVVVLAVGVVLLWVASAALTARHNRQVASTVTGGVVDLGDASFLAAQFQRGDDAPMYFPDVSGSAQRSVYLVHDGGRSDRGWTAFRAQVPGEDPECQWNWNTSTGEFDASCDDTRHADATGSGLEQYEVTVSDGTLRVDLRRDAPDSATSSTSATTAPGTS